jgi:hypothetical protein
MWVLMREEVVAEASGTKDIPDLSGLGESELLSIPEENLPAALLPEFEQRREEALQKKQTSDASGFNARLNSQSRDKERNRTDDLQRDELEAYHNEMRDIYEREDALLDELNTEEREDKKRLAQIDSRALKLSDGRLAYVGTNGTYVDQGGQLLRGNDAAEAKAQNQLHPDAATWAERSATEQKIEDEQKMRQDVQNMQAQEKQEDSGNLSADQMANNLRDRGATISRYETEFAERAKAGESQLEATGKTVTDATFGGDDYIAAYGGSGSTLGPAFAAAVNGTNAGDPNAKPVPQPQNTPVQALTR